ncbi:hypothetical protein TNCV_713251 [Trichonephila clavipes]|nr:hypothetical protein TNCV_713251 [Trichonephila clavipes]
MIPPTHKRTKTVIFLDVTVFRHTQDYLHSKCGSFVDVANSTRVRFIAKNSRLRKSNNAIVLGPFDESTSCLMIVLMNAKPN